MANWKNRIDTQEAPFIALGPFKLRLPFIHYRFEWPDYLQGLLMCAVDLAAVPLIIELLGMPFEAAIAIEQLKKLKVILKKKVYMAERLTKGLSGLEGLKLPKIGKNNTHVYYSYSIKINSKIIKTKKNRLIKYLKAEGLPVNDRYVNILEYNMYLDKKISNYYPWSTKGKNFFYSKKSNVYKQIVNLNDNEFMDLFFCKYDFSKQDIDLIINCFKKVWKKLDLS